MPHTDIDGPIGERPRDSTFLVDVGILGRKDNGEMEREHIFESNRVLIGLEFQSAKSDDFFTAALGASDCIEPKGRRCAARMRSGTSSARPRCRALLRP